MMGKFRAARWYFIFLAVCILLVFCISAALAAPKEPPSAPRNYLLPGHGTIQLLLPVNWKDRYEISEDKTSHRLTLSPEGGTGFEFVVSPSWGSPAAPLYLPEDRKLSQMVQRMIDEARPMVVENIIKLEELKGEGVSGYYFTVTGRKHEDGYKYKTRGVLRAGDVMVAFTLRAADGQESVIPKALAILRGLGHGCRYYERGATHTALSVGEVGWSLRFPNADWELASRVTASDGLGAQYGFQSKARGMKLEVTLMRTARCASARACQTAYWNSARQAYPGAKDLRILDSGEFAALKFWTSAAGPSAQVDLMAHAYREGYEVDVHVSGQKGGTEPDYAQLMEFLAGLKIQ